MVHGNRDVSVFEAFFAHKKFLLRRPADACQDGQLAPAAGAFLCFVVFFATGRTLSNVRPVAKKTTKQRNAPAAGASCPSWQASAGRRSRNFLWAKKASKTETSRLPCTMPANHGISKKVPRRPGLPF